VVRIWGGNQENGVRFQSGSKTYLFFKVSLPIEVFIQPPVQCVERTLSLGLKRPGREAEHSPPHRAEVKKIRLAIPPLMYLMVKGLPP